MIHQRENIPSTPHYNYKLILAEIDESLIQQFVLMFFELFSHNSIMRKQLRINNWVGIMIIPNYRLRVDN